MELTADLVQETIGKYPEVQPLAHAEEEHIEMLPDMLASGDYGWRDPEWIVQWYGRRFLGGMPNAERRALEEAYDDNDYEDVHAAIEAAVDADSPEAKLSHLMSLAGVDVPIASAFCQFLHPERYVVVDERQWSTLREYGELDAAYPSPPTAEDYERYLETYRAVAERCECSLWDLYRTLWVLAEES
jgi:hypothetical protein